VACGTGIARSFRWLGEARARGDRRRPAGDDERSSRDYAGIVVGAIGKRDRVILARNRWRLTAPLSLRPRSGRHARIRERAPPNSQSHDDSRPGGRPESGGRTRYGRRSPPGRRKPRPLRGQDFDLATNLLPATSAEWWSRDGASQQQRQQAGASSRKRSSSDDLARRCPQGRGGQGMTAYFGGIQQTRRARNAAGRTRSDPRRAPGRAVEIPATSPIDACV